MTWGPAKFIDPQRHGLEDPWPALGLVQAEAWALDEVVKLKMQASRPVFVIFPVKDASEAVNLEKLLVILEPLVPDLLDGAWLACGSREPGELAGLAQRYPWVQLFLARQDPPPDQPAEAWGKGAVMRAALYFLAQTGQVTDPRAIIQFIDADIVPSYFRPAWVTGAVGAILAFEPVEAAKLVYFRPRGGRLNNLLRSFLALIPEAGVQRLQDLVYLLSGEIAGTMKFWSSVPFKTGYGVEILMLLALALDLVRLHPARADLDQVAQVFVGKMDHRHTPLQSTRRQRGLDQMAGNVFQTVLETLEQAGVLAWPGGGAAIGRLRLPVPGYKAAGQPAWLETSVRELTLPPLKSRPEIAAALNLGD